MLEPDTTLHVSTLIKDTFRDELRVRTWIPCILVHTNACV